MSEQMCHCGTFNLTVYNRRDNSYLDTSGFIHTKATCPDIPLTALTAERDALIREVDVAKSLLESAKAITFRDHSRMLWTSTNGVFKWEISTDIRKNNYKGRYDTALEAFAALEGESR